MTDQQIEQLVRADRDLITEIISLVMKLSLKFKIIGDKTIDAKMSMLRFGYLE